ncbi:MAG TPA: bifunctional riboflavin kinase/FAD synthetase, partial [Campylobacterales bacterium]|nr:bifunctional riboflavin kinase/FAD synthetase [Campylobacterales bacterium]
QFLDFIRENRKFPDLESLKIAIQQDIAKAQKLLQ